MSQHNLKPFRLTLLALAVLSLGACSTTSNRGGFDFGGIGTGLGKIGEKTAEIGSSAWEGTKNVLNIGTPQESPELDEVDLALMEDDAELKNAQSDVTKVQLGAAEPAPILPRNVLKPNTASQDSAVAAKQTPETTKLLLPTNGAKRTNVNANGEIVVLGANDLQQSNPQQPSADPMTLASDEPVARASNPDSVRLLDLTHVVSESENLWQIAKKTTGDANNWHVLADINNLGPNASVIAGQKLTIPADMVRADYRGANQPAMADAAEAKAVQAVATATAQATVAQPAGSSEERAVVAFKLPQADAEAPATPTVPEVAAVKPEVPAAPTEGGKTTGTSMALQVGAGETLWEFAKRTTGDATNWKTIALENEFDEKRIGRIRPGQTIYVPVDIVRARDADGILVAKGDEKLVSTAVFGGIVPKSELAVAATAAVLAGTNQPAVEAPTAPTAQAAQATEPETAEGDIKIVEAAFQDDSAIKPVTADSLSEEGSLAVDSAVDSSDSKLSKVMIKGTYYPKAVYHNADFSSTLLMRVSPGTQLRVSKAIGPWLEVKTTKGIGYVHSRDIK